MGGTPLAAQQGDLPAYLADRGRGIATSLFGTYVESGEWLVYPFYEYSRTGKFEYQPQELGSIGETDFHGELVEREALLFLAYGISNRWAVEFEAALYTQATFDRAPEDASGLAERIEESGMGDVEAQITWLMQSQTEDRPELFAFAAVDFPFQEDELLIGTSAWGGKVGVGIVRGFGWGTLTGRATLAYDGEESSVELGEYAFEYLKRLSRHWRVVALIEGESDDVSLIGEVQWAFFEHGMLKFGTGFGLTEKAADCAPEVGVLFHF